MKSAESGRFGYAVMNDPWEIHAWSMGDLCLIYGGSMGEGRLMIRVCVDDDGGMHG